MIKKLYLMRHGETLFNVLHKIQGASDAPLTDKGIAQGKAVGTFLEKAGIKIDHAYSSTQERASDTLENVVTMPYERLKGLKEWNFGLFEGESENLNPKHKPGENSYGDSFVPYGGEAADEVQKRMVKTLVEIFQADDHKNVLVVSHGGAIYMFLQAWAAIQDIQRLPFRNGYLFELDFDTTTNKFKLKGCLFPERITLDGE